MSNYIAPLLTGMLVGIAVFAGCMIAGCFLSVWIGVMIDSAMDARTGGLGIPIGLLIALGVVVLAVRAGWKLGRRVFQNQAQQDKSNASG
jgi:membrane protein implicated in regulation of membrane protease activity